MIIRDLYKTIITCSAYNVFYERTSIKVTVKLVDFDNNPVKNRSVALKCNRGEFIADSSLSSTSYGQTYIATTNSNGEVNVYYKTTGWGVDKIYCNDASVTIGCHYDTGLKEVTLDSSSSVKPVNYSSSVYEVPYYRYVDGDMMITGVVGNSNTSAVSTSSYVNFASIPLKFAPSGGQDFLCNGSGNELWIFKVDTSGNLGIHRYGHDTGSSGYNLGTSKRWLPMYAHYVRDVNIFINKDGGL